MSSFVIHNAHLVLENEVLHGNLCVEDGRITAIAGGASSVPGAIDLGGDYLMPGFIEVHTDNFERHLMPRPKVQWSEVPALLAHDAEIVAAGITTVFDALGVGDADEESVRGRDWAAVLHAIDHCDEQGLLRADHLVHVRCELPAPNTLRLFQPFVGHERVALISVMDHTPGQRQWENVDKARTYYTGRKGWSDAKFDEQLEQSARLQAEYVQPHRAWLVDYCRQKGIALASHDDTTADHVALSHSEGARMSEFPTTLVAAREAHRRSMHNVMGGPNVVRGGSHSGNVAATDLAREGLLDILSSDYVPGSLLTAVTRLVDEDILDLPQAVATVSSKPAQSTRLTDRGVLAQGRRADLLRVRFVRGSRGGRHPVVRQVWRAGERVL